MFWLSTGVVLAGVGQTASLPLFISSFENNGGPYFVVWFCSMFFTVLFALLTSIDQFSKRISDATKHFAKTGQGMLLLFLIGAFDAMNGIFIVYSSSPLRTPTAMQPVLLQLTIPITLVFSRWILKKVYTPKQMVGAFIVFLSLVVFLVPTFVAIKKGKGTHLQSGWWWPIFMTMGLLPGAAMNVLEEKVFEHCPSFNVNLLLFFESFFQWFTVTALFWTDIIKGFGTTSDLTAFGKQFREGFTCFANAPGQEHRCEYTAGLAIIFALSYTLTYIFGALVMKHASANYQGMLASVTNPLTIVFWLAFPGLNKWAGGAKYTTLDIVFSLLSLPLMVTGAVMFRYYERDDLTERSKSRALSGKVAFAHMLISPEEAEKLGLADVPTSKESLLVNGRATSRDYQSDDSGRV